ncbi:MAG: TonB-dependent receptor [Alphaproteobacteria bacterium]|nr:TonB-dependent receptor [Alphaproteobacteria bacterium]
MKLALLLGAAVAPFALAAAQPAFADTLTGRVTDSAGVRSLQGAEVRLLELNRRTEVGPDGVYRFADVAPGRYTLRVDYVGAATSEQMVTISGGIVTVDVGLTDFASSEGDVVEPVIVIGQRANLSSALSRQRAAEGIESVLTRDAIGQFPDQNVAEALRRLPGVNILNDQGEGRFIALRGLDPNLNSASINGARVPAPESDVRSVALDVIPSELIESIEIKKSLTPDMDADTLGGSIEIKTANAFDRGRPFAAFSAEGSYNEATETWSPKYAADFSSTFLDDRLGMAGGLSYYKRRFATDNVEMDGWGEGDNGLIFADTVEYRDYDVTRERRGATLSLDYRLDEGTTLFMRALRSDFADQEYKAQTGFEFDFEDGPSSGSGDTVTFLSDDGEIKIGRELKDRFETQDITSIVAGGETFAGAWTFNYELSWSKSREKEAGSVDPSAFEASFEDPGDFGVTFDYSDYKHPVFSVPAAFQGVFLDPDTYEFDKAEVTSLSLSEDEEITARFDAAREFALSSGGAFEVQFGGKARQREKTYNFTLDVLEAINDFTLADWVGEQTYGLAPIEPVVSHDISDFVLGNLNLFERDAIDSDFESAAADYGVDEDVYSGYLLGRYDNGPLQVIGGLRVERTENDLRGNIVQLVEEDGDLPGGGTADEDTVLVMPVSFTKEYTHWLPSVNVKYEAAENLIARGAVYRSLMRPNIGAIAPRFLVNEDNEGEFGNPDLEPYEAWNYDASLEWYFAPSAVVSGGLFYKSIDNFIVTANFEGDDPILNYPGQVPVDEAEMAINGDDATVFGFEFNYQQALTFLPGALDGLLVSFNYTYTDTEADIDGRTITLPAASENTFNATLGYEKGPVSFRLAAAYRDGYLDELGGEDDGSEDRLVKDHIQWDLSGKYRVTSNVQIFAEFVNLGDEPYIAYQSGPGRDRLLQYEEYSWTAKTGIRLTF